MEIKQKIYEFLTKISENGKKIKQIITMTIQYIKILEKIKKNKKKIKHLESILSQLEKKKKENDKTSVTITLIDENKNKNIITTNYYVLENQILLEIKKTLSENMKLMEDVGGVTIQIG